jgi:hypothetical protein
LAAGNGLVGERFVTLDLITDITGSASFIWFLFDPLRQHLYTPQQRGRRMVGCL